MRLYELTIHQAHERLRNKEITSLELTRAVLERIESVDGRVGAYLTVTADQALEQARRADALISAGNGRPLTGIPLALKDLICTRGVRTTCASRILDNFTPPYDAFVVTQLKQAGAASILFSRNRRTLKSAKRLTSTKGLIS